LTEIMVSLAIAVAVRAVDRLDGRFQMAFVHVASRYDLAIFHLQEFPRVARPLHAPAHHTQRDALRRSRTPCPAQYSTRNDDWSSQPRSRHDKKLPTVNAPLVSDIHKPTGQACSM